MEETVQCGECGQRYDSNENAFCPRCGSLSRGRDVSGAVATASRRDPDLRRVRTSGVVLMMMGALATAYFLWAVAVPPETDDETLELLSTEDFLANRPGGDLRLLVTDGDVPVDVPVAVRAMNGTLLFEATTAGGWYNVTLPVAFANLTVGGPAGADNATDAQQNTTQEQNGTAAGDAPGQVHKVYVSEDQTLRVEVDLAVPQGEPEWHAAGTVPFVRPVLGFLAFMSLVVLAGGFAAFRLRLLGLAVTGAVVAIMPGLIFLTIAPLQGLILALPGALALAFILRGRRHFRRPGQA